MEHRVTDPVRTTLDELRAMLDQVDDELVALLGRRFGYTDRIGRLKREHHLPWYDADREVSQRDRLQALAHRQGVPPRLVAELHARITEVVVARHQHRSE